MLVPAVALAAQPQSGKWQGKLATNGAKVTFRVSGSGGTLRSFAVVQMPVYCYGSGLTTKVFLIPSVRVRNNGRFSRTYKTRNSGGQVDGDFEVSGRFSTSRRAAGQVDYNRGGCSSGNVRFSAHKR